MEPNELVDRIGYEIDKYRDAKDCDLQSACIAYLEACGMVCLKRHTEAPTEEGRYLGFHGSTIRVVEIHENGTVQVDSTSGGGRCMALDRYSAFLYFPCWSYLGPLPEGE